MTHETNVRYLSAIQTLVNNSQKVSDQLAGIANDPDLGKVDLDRIRKIIVGASMTINTLCKAVVAQCEHGMQVQDHIEEAQRRIENMD